MYEKVSMSTVSANQGIPELVELDIPTCTEHAVLIRTEYSAISPGTEMLIINSTKKNKSLSHLGYSAVGIVVEVGDKVKHIQVGQRVACYGAPYVKHAQYLLVPSPLAAPVPSHVDPKEAAFAGLGAIAIHAIRQAELQFGESVAVVGLGILGQIMAQIADAAALQVFATDLLSSRCDILRDRGLKHVSYSIEDMQNKMNEVTEGQGVDSALLCASGKNDLIDRSMDWIRDRGKIVIVGDLEMSFSRSKMFGKEANILISRAGGPGRYDKEYETDGRGYPLGYVRWTEGRNIAEYIRLLAEQRIQVSPLISHEYSLEDAPQAYDVIINRTEDTLGILFKY